MININTRTYFRRRSALRELALGLAWGMALAVPWTTANAQHAGDIGLSSGDVMRGWRVFHDKKCVDCHAIWMQGGRVGPDLGRTRAGRLTNGQLAGIMWNHIPKMLSWREQVGHPPTVLTHQEMSDLFELIFFVRQLDELGDPRRGEEILRRKGCAECHATDTSGDSVGPDLAKWGEYVNPVAWAQMMWEHAPMMEEAMKRSDMTWPELEGADLVHLVAFVRSIGVSGDRTYLQPGSVARGRITFLEKKCNDCHPGAGPDLTQAELPASVAALASRMWNHSPAMARVMREEELIRQPINPQELADILAYVLALGTRDQAGDPALGEQVFARKGCMQCHDLEETDGSDIPSLSDLRGDALPVNMAAAMWNHGQTMLERMTEAGLSWPVFDDREMVDLLAYLRAVNADSRSEDATNN